MSAITNPKKAQYIDAANRMIERSLSRSVSKFVARSLVRDANKLRKLAKPMDDKPRTVRFWTVGPNNGLVRMSLSIKHPLRIWHTESDDGTHYENATAVYRYIVHEGLVVLGTCTHEADRITGKRERVSCQRECKLSNLTARAFHQPNHKRDFSRWTVYQMPEWVKTPAEVTRYL